MGVDSFIRKMLPRDNKFHALFVQDVTNLAEAAQALTDLLKAAGPVERGRLVKEVERLEHIGDEITHTIFKELGLTFVTPLDREDISGLATAFDNILDQIYRAATCIELYHISDFSDAVCDLTEVIQRSAGELQRAVPHLNDRRSPAVIREACVRINAYENQADGIFHRALGRLFQEEKDAIHLIKERELLAMLEAATDRCEDAAVLIENVLIKYA